MLKNLKSKLESNQIQNKIPLFIVVVFSIFIAICLIYINSSSNILGHNYRDAYLYLIQAYRFSGYQISGYEYTNYLSPLIPFITSILFRLGFVSLWSLFTVTGIFYQITVLGIYYLLNLRFNKFYSMFGAILYGSMSINLMWTANGTLDIPSIALAIWALYFFILALEKNQKFFYLAFPIAALSFFAKYTGALIVIPMMIYFLSKRDIFGNIKNYIKKGIGGAIASLIFIIPFIAYYLLNNIPFGFLNQAQEISSITTTSTQAAAEHTTNDLFFYISSMPRFVYSPQKLLGYFILALGTIGLIYGFYKLIQYIQDYYPKCDEKLSISFIPDIKLSKNLYFIALMVSVILMILSFLTAGLISFMISESLFIIGAFIFTIPFNSIFTDLTDLDYLKNNEEKSLKNQISERNNDKYPFFRYDLTMIVWFLAFLIFFSAHITKADRYFTAIAPGFVFLIIFSIERIVYLINKTTINFSVFNLKINKEKLAKGFLAITLILLLSASIGYLTINRHDSLVDDELNTSRWIEENIPYENTTILADRGPIYTWYLTHEVTYYPSTANITELGNLLNEHNASYYILTPQKDSQNDEYFSNDGGIPGFTKIKTFGEVKIYKNNNISLKKQIT